MIKHWTQEEEILLIDMRAAGSTLQQIADKLDRSLEAVKTRAKRLKARGLIEGRSSKGKYDWTDGEVAKLYEDLDYNELEVILSRSRRSIMSKCEKLGISKRLPGSSKKLGTMYRDKPATVYLVDFGEFKKVGVTQVPIEERLVGYRDFKLLDSCTMSIEDALETEMEILKNMRPFRAIGDIRRGWSECFKFDCAQMEDLL
jgi:predicted transcriptional regulator